MTPAGTARATSASGDFVLVLSCPDRPGIVHAVTGFLVRHGGNIVESQQFGGGVELLREPLAFLSVAVQVYLVYLLFRCSRDVGVEASPGV